MRTPHPDLDPSSHGLTIWDLDRTFHAGGFGVTTLRALLDRLRQTYAGTMGVQYMHIDAPEERALVRAAHGAVRESMAARFRHERRF
jgi:2-oxoglutarate decarboxylase